jgi:glutamyl endopeptidase
MDTEQQNVDKIVGELPPLDDLAGQLSGDPELILAEAFKIPGEKAIIWPGPALDAELGTALNKELDNMRKQLLLEGRRAVDKLRASHTWQSVQLSQAEHMGLELVHAIAGRPALLVQDESFVTPPSAWVAPLEEAREIIEDTRIPAVGRISFRDNGQDQLWGTGFLVGERLLMTNRHVADDFCVRGQDSKWRLWPERPAKVDFRAESGLSARHEFAIEDVVGIHDQVDLALLRLAAGSLPGSLSNPLPEPVVVASQPPATPLQGRMVYIVGYPMTENVWSDPLLRMLIFNNIYWVKRLQPGRLIDHVAAAMVVQHDCSTLGGNSGSPVIDLASHHVIGLHFSGLYMKQNNAVALWQLRDDPLLRAAGVNFATVSH